MNLIIVHLFTNWKICLHQTIKKIASITTSQQNLERKFCRKICDINDCFCNELFFSVIHNLIVMMTVLLLGYTCLLSLHPVSEIMMFW